MKINIKERLKMVFIQIEMAALKNNTNKESENELLNWKNKWKRIKKKKTGLKIYLSYEVETIKQRIRNIISVAKTGTNLSRRASTLYLLTGLRIAWQELWQIIYVALLQKHVVNKWVYSRFVISLLRIFLKKYSFANQMLNGKRLNMMEKCW